MLKLKSASSFISWCDRRLVSGLLRTVSALLCLCQSPWDLWPSLLWALGLARWGLVRPPWPLCSVGPRAGVAFGTSAEPAGTRELLECPGRPLGLQRSIVPIHCWVRDQLSSSIPNPWTFDKWLDLDTFIFGGKKRKKRKSQSCIVVLALLSVCVCFVQPDWFSC